MMTGCVTLERLMGTRIWKTNVSNYGINSSFMSYSTGPIGKTL